MSDAASEMQGGNAPNVVPLRPRVNDDWFSTLFTDCAAQVSRYIYRRTNADAVEDLTAETFATAWRKRDEIPQGFEVQWLYRTAGFLVANHNRKHKPVLLEEFPEIAQDSDPSAIVIEDDALRKAFYRLSEKDRKVLVLAAWEGQSSEQIAEVIGGTANSAAVALSRARARFSTTFAHETNEYSETRSHTQ